VLWLVRRGTRIAPESDVTSSQKREQQDHQADQERHVYELAYAVQPGGANQPCGQQKESNSEKHFAAEKAAGYPKTAKSSAPDGGRCENSAMRLLAEDTEGKRKPRRFADA
jgi:hypothetical protein